MFICTTLLVWLTALSDFADGAISDSKCVTNGNVQSGVGACPAGDVFLRGQYVEVGIHKVGSYGTSEVAPSGYVYAGQNLGFIADYDKNGFYSTSPGYAGDYFVPGAPVEGMFVDYFIETLKSNIDNNMYMNCTGWLLQWTSADGTVHDYMMEGLMGMDAIYPTTFEITSTESTQSAQWVGRQGEIEISKVTQFKNTDAYFTTSVTVKNIGTSKITNFYCK